MRGKFIFFCWSLSFSNYQLFQDIWTSEKSFRTVNSLDSLAIRTGEEDSPFSQAGSSEHLKDFSKWQLRYRQSLETCL